MPYTMSKLKLLSIGVIGLLLVNMGIVVFLFMKKPPHPPGGGPPMGQEGPKLIIIERLNFDKEQVAEYEKLIDEHQSSMRTTGDSIRMVKNDLYQTLNNENFAGKDSLVTRLGVLQNQIELIHYNHFAQLKKLCKPAQFNAFNDLTKDLARFFAPGKKGPPPPKD